MLALVYDGSLRLDRHHPEPAAADGSAVVRVLQAGICSTDLEIVRGYMGFRGVPGHEFVGVVEAAPDRGLVGRRVVGEINCVCARCDLCRQGLSNHCRDRTVVGIYGRDGAFAERLRLPPENLHVLPDAVDDDAAVFVEPLAAAYQVVKQLGPSLDARTWVTVLGSGRLGLLVAQVLKEKGCPVRVVGRNPHTLGLCERWGIRHRPVGDVAPRKDQDVVVDCMGSSDGLRLATGMVRPRGTIVLKSTVAPSAAAAVDLSPVVVDEVTVLGSRCGPFGPAIEALRQRRVDVASLIAKRMRLDDAPEAFEAAGRPGTLKVLLRVA